MFTDQPQHDNFRCAGVFFFQLIQGVNKLKLGAGLSI